MLKVAVAVLEEEKKLVKETTRQQEGVRECNYLLLYSVFPQGNHH